VLHTFAEAFAMDHRKRQLFAEPYILKRLFNYSCHTTVHFQPAGVNSAPSPETTENRTCKTVAPPFPDAGSM
ncbi:hypothetical protein ACSLNU_16535, partial [Klebsiella variicola]